MRITQVRLAAVLIGLALVTDSHAAPPETVRFNRDVRRILSDNCFRCHGPDEKHREGGLRLDEFDGATAKLESGHRALVPGDLTASELVERITSKDEFERMPPPDSGKTLSADDIAILKRWVEQGGKYEGHWSFIAPSRPELPTVAKRDWSPHAIDRFVLARLESEGLSPTERADRRTLIRRVTFDLTGLPPTPEEVAAFLADESPDAYEKLVDRLLDSPQYGVHMARYWLDAVRYGDTHGLHLDNYREMWPYRDWVVNAFNLNMPFDRFATEQLAGDLLPEATLAQQIASGYNRCNVTTSEGGSIAEEVYVRNVVDRVETFSTVFLGLTGGCAVCHDHKFDPISQRDFYSLFAFFNNLEGNPLDGNRKDHAPIVRVPTPGQEVRLAAIAKRLGEVGPALRARKTSPKANTEFLAWLTEAEKNVEKKSDVLEGLLARYEFDEESGNEVRDSLDPNRKGTFEGGVTRVEGKFGRGLKFTNNGSVNLGPDVGRFDNADHFSYGAWIKTPGNVNGTPVARMDTASAFRGWDLYVNGRKVAMHLINAWTGDALKVTTKADVLQPNKWHHVFVTYDGSNAAGGVIVYVDGKPQAHVTNVGTLKSTTLTEVPARLGRRQADSPFTNGIVDEVRLYGRTLNAAEVGTLAGGDPLGPILAIARNERTAEQTKTLQNHFFDNVDEPYRKLVAEKNKLEGERNGINGKLATTLVFKERGNMKPAFILERGSYEHKGEQVERNTPGFLPAFPEDAPRNRLGLAQWLTSPEHPLTARVMVNRLWQRCFGTGLVKTSEDFGSQGEWPSHPALLDWLAVEFRESGWDVKHVMRLIVTSAAYRQDSRVTPALVKRDPENRLLARGPRFRLDAEMLRDQALTVGGLLRMDLGGPSVKVPQPAGVWKAVGYSSSNTANFAADAAPRIYRRSVYTFWKRTAPPPQMRTFDAPSRESCRVRRERTNTPLQALVAMNEQQYFESARVLAERTMKSTDAAPEARIRSIFERATARAPEPDEVLALLEVYTETQAEYAGNVEAASKLIRVGNTPADAKLDPVELAAWTIVANAVLNLDEVVTKN